MTELLDSLIPDAYPYLRGKIRLSASDGEPVRDCGDFRDGNVVLAVVDHFLERFPGADRRAALSLWSMYYFSHLVIGPLLFWLRERRVVPMTLTETRLCLDGQTGGPAAFLVATEGEVRHGSTVFEAMHEAIRHHAEPVIEAISGSGKVSPKLLWNNLAVYAEWAIREFCIDDDALRAEALELLSCEAWPDGWKNPWPANSAARSTRRASVSLDARSAACATFSPAFPVAA